MHRVSVLCVLGLLVLSAPGCPLLCDTDEERSVNVGTGEGLLLARDTGGSPSRVNLQGRVMQLELSEAAFDDLFDIVADGATPYDGVVLPMSGDDPVTGELVALSLALPTPLRNGARYLVGGAFDVALGEQGGQAWTPRPLAHPERAEVGLKTGTYTFPPPEYHASYAATQAGGTIDVRRRGDEAVELTLDLVLRDGTGRTFRLTGTATAYAERYTPPCT
jgi:hypothetical protein